MATKAEQQRARAKIRQLREQATRDGLLMEELAVVLGIDVDTLGRHLGKGVISASRARQYAAIVNLAVSESAVHLVIRRRGDRPKPLSGEQLEAEKRRAIGLLDQLRGGARQP